MVHKYLKCLPLLVIPFLSTACSSTAQNTYQYKGQSDNWSSVLTVTVSGNEETDKVTFTYNGADMKSVGTITDTIELPNGTKLSGSDQTLDPHGKTELQGGGTNVVLPSKDGIAKATVEWNGKKETLEMKAK